MAEPVTITLDWHDWGDIQQALSRHAFDIAESEVRRTGGRGFASGGKAHAVERMLAVRQQIEVELLKHRASGPPITDSAGTTCVMVPIERIAPGDVVILGWRTEVQTVEHDGHGHARILWKDHPHPDQWNDYGSELPVELVESPTKEEDDGRAHAHGA